MSTTIDVPVSEDVAAIPLDQLHPADPRRFARNTIWPVFERLRREDPVHFTPESEMGPYWSITRWEDIMKVDSDHKTFSSEPNITLLPQVDGQDDNLLPGLAMFIAMDPPKHDIQRKTVSPAVSPANLQVLAPLIRERAAKILDDLPIGEEFDWVDKVSKELTAMTLATLFGMPQEDRRKLIEWSDIVTTPPGPGRLVETREEKLAVFREYHAYFAAMWNERINAEPSGDLISMLAHSPATRDMAPLEFFGNVILLTVGGNDTTRNTLTGSVYALNKYPEQYAKLRSDPAMIPSMVSETIRWQTPLAYMKRVATRDVELGGKHIRAGDTVVMWYVSGNRDEQVIDRPDEYIIDRERPRHHMSFGFGIHRCVGNRLAELQLQIVWEEALKRFPEIKVVEEPTRVFSSFVKGYEKMNVIIPSRY